MNHVGAEMTQAVGLTPRKSVAEVRRVERNSEVTSEAVRVLVDGTGSCGAGVAAPEAAADRGAEAALGGGTRMSTV